MSERQTSRAHSPSFPTGSTHGTSASISANESNLISPARSLIRSSRVLLIIAIAILLFVDLEIFDDVVMGDKYSTHLNDDVEREEGKIDAGGSKSTWNGKRRNPLVAWKWGNVIDCCPLRIGSMFRKGESTLYDYLTNNLLEIADRAADDNFFSEFTFGALNDADDIIIDMKVDRIIRDIHSLVMINTNGEPLDFVLQNRFSSLPSSQKNDVRIIDIANILQARSHKCSQGILEYLNNQTTPMILLHGSAYTADNCGDGGIVAMSKIVEMLKSPSVLMYISSVSVLIHGSVKAIDQRLAASPKTLILPCGLHSSINSDSVYRYIRNIYINRSKKNNLLQITTANIPSSIHKYLLSTFNPPSEYTDNPGIDYFRSLSKSKFVLCTDIWKIDESLLVGAIPIVESHTNLNYVYWNLPVMFLDSFRSITPELLDDAYECFTMYRNKFKYEQLNIKYWRDMISLLIQGNSSVLPVSSFDNPYCNYRNGISQRWNETVIGEAFLRGDKQINLDIRDKLDIFRLPKEKYEIYLRLRQRRALRVAN